MTRDIDPMVYKSIALDVLSLAFTKNRMSIFCATDLRCFTTKYLFQDCPVISFTDICL
jgi:hypothetical protein